MIYSARAKKKCERKNQNQIFEFFFFLKMQRKKLRCAFRSKMAADFPICVYEYRNGDDCCHLPHRNAKFRQSWPKRYPQMQGKPLRRCCGAWVKKRRGRGEKRHGWQPEGCRGAAFPNAKAILPPLFRTFLHKHRALHAFHPRPIRLFSAPRFGSLKNRVTFAVA